MNKKIVMVAWRLIRAGLVMELAREKNETNGGVWLKSESASALDMQEAKTCHTAAKKRG